MSERKVVVTGLGAVSPLGHSVHATWERILNGESGVRPISSFDTDAYSTKFWANIENFDPSELINTKEQKKMDLTFGIKLNPSVNLVVSFIKKKVFL